MHAAGPERSGIATHVRDPRWAEEFGTRIALMVRGGESSASLQLSPVDLGPDGCQRHHPRQPGQYSFRRRAGRDARAHRSVASRGCAKCWRRRVSSSPMRVSRKGFPGRRAATCRRRCAPAGDAEADAPATTRVIALGSARPLRVNGDIPSRKGDSLFPTALVALVRVLQIGLSPSCTRQKTAARRPVFVMPLTFRPWHARCTTPRSRTIRSGEG